MSIWHPHNGEVYKKRREKDRRKEKDKSGNSVAVEMDRKNAANIQIARRHKIYGYLLFQCWPMLTNFNGSKDTRMHGKLSLVLRSFSINSILDLECQGWFM